MLEYTGTKYEDKQYEMGGPPDFNRDSWFSVKETLGLELPNVSMEQYTVPVLCLSLNFTVHSTVFFYCNNHHFKYALFEWKFLLS